MKKNKQRLNNKVKLAKSNFYNEMQFYAHSAKRGVMYDGFEVIPRVVTNKSLATKLINEIKTELRNEKKTYYFWVGVFFKDEEGRFACDSLCLVKEGITIPEIDTWLNGEIQTLIDSVEGIAQGWAFVGTLNPEKDLSNDEMFLEFFSKQGAFNAEKANYIAESAQLEKHINTAKAA